MLQTNLKNETLILVTYFKTPDTVKNVNPDTNETTFSGLFFEALNIFSRDLGFRYKVIEPPDGQWGVPMKNGSFTGIIGMLSREEADIGIGGFTMTSDRRRVVDFLQPWWEESVTYVMRKNPISTIDNSFKPISVEIWLLCLSTALVLTAVYWIFNLLWFPMHPRSLHMLKDCGQNLFLITASALKQALVRLPKRGTMRILLTFWWLCTVIISVAYSANLVAMMSVVVDSVPVRSLEELSTQAQIKISCLGGTALSGMLEASDIPMYKRMHNNIDVWLELKDYETAFETEVTTGNMILIDERNGVEQLRAKSPKACNLALGKDSFFAQNIGFPVRKTFPYKEEFNAKIFQMIDSGLMNKWRKKHLLKEPVCDKSSSKARSAGLVDIFGAILALTVGVCSSLLVLLFECKLYKSAQ